MTNRRSFIAANLAAPASPRAGPCVRANRRRANRAQSCEILMLGGTGFLGPHLVEAARAGPQPHAVQPRQDHPALSRRIKDIEKLQGDRKGDLKALETRRKWDAVIDTSGYVPRGRHALRGAAAPSVGQYVFVSSISVYAKMDKPGMDETAPLATMADRTSRKYRRDLRRA